MPSSHHASDQLQALTGRTIVHVRAMQPEELKLFGWGNPRDTERAVVLILDDGMAVIPMIDPEGNGPGFLELNPTE